MTEGRETVLGVMAGAKRGEHLSAEDIYLKVHQICPAVGLASVYRTLDLLVHLSMVDKFDFGDGRARYEFAEGSSGVKHHHHLVGFKITGHVVQFYGLCKRCIGKNEDL